MANPTAIVPYHDPFDISLESIFNIGVNINPCIADLDPVSSVPHRQQLGGDDIFIEDAVDPYDDPILWDFVNVSSNPNDCEAGSSQFRGETSNQHEEKLQNQYGNSMQVSTWPVPAVPFSCSCCQVLREIIHTNGNHTTKLEIHGRLGMICHAVLDNQPGVNVVLPGHNKYHMFDFCKKSIENVKQFLVKYCEDRKQDGYFLLQDPLSIYYEALCVGLEWDENLNNDDFFQQSPPPHTTGECGMNQPEAECQMNQSEAEEQAERTPHKTPFAAQRERTRKLTLNDLADYFHLPIETAAKRLNTCPTVVKKVCRKYNLDRWPYRKIKSLEKQLSTLRDGLNTMDIGERARIEAEIERIQREMTDACGGIPRG